MRNEPPPRRTCARLMNAVASTVRLALRRAGRAAWRRLGSHAAVRLPHPGDGDAGSATAPTIRANAAAALAATSSRWTWTARATPSRRALGAAGQSWARMASDRLGAPQGAPSPARCGARRRQRRGWSTATARCSTPTSATSRTTPADLQRPRQRAAGAGCTSGCTPPVFARMDAASVEQPGLSGRGWARRLDSGARSSSGRGSDDEVLARTEALSSRTLTQVTARYRPDLEYADLRHADGYALRLRHHADPRTAEPGQQDRRTPPTERPWQRTKDLVVGLDIGTAKVMVVVAEVLPGGELQARRPGRRAHAWPQARRGGQHRRHRAEHPAGAEGGRDDGRLQDHRVYTGITGSHIRGQNSTGMVIGATTARSRRWTWRASSRPPRRSTSPNDQRCCWWSRRSSSSTATR